MPLDNRSWNPETWRPRTPNPAFLRARIDDKFWAARKVMAFNDDLIRAAVEAGEFDDPDGEAFLVRALIERRDAIGRAYLTVINPVVDPRLDAPGALTFTNAARHHGLERAPEGYRAAWYTFDNATGQTEWIGETRDASERLPIPDGLPMAAGAFVKVEISATAAPRDSWEQPIEVYFRRTEQGQWNVVGLVRVPDGLLSRPGS